MSSSFNITFPGIANQEYVMVSSRRGSVWLTNNMFDPDPKTAEYKACAVKIEKAT